VSSSTALDSITLRYMTLHYITLQYSTVQYMLHSNKSGIPSQHWLDSPSCSSAGNSRTHHCQALHVGYLCLSFLRLCRSLLCGYIARHLRCTRMAEKLICLCC
jgi:hypothetical protein